MIEYGYILPNGEEIDLSNYKGKVNSAHYYYAKEYIDKLSKNDPIKMKFQNFISSHNFETLNIHSEFVIRVLGWIKVGSLTYPGKYLLIASINNTFDVQRAKFYEKYEKAGFVIDCIMGIQ